MLENVCESVRVYMNQADHDFTWNVFEDTGFIFG